MYQLYDPVTVCIQRELTRVHAKYRKGVLLAALL